MLPSNTTKGKIMRNNLLTAKSMTVLGIRYLIVPVESVFQTDQSPMVCPKCGKKKKGKYQGNVGQSGMYEEINIDFWHCAACGHDFGVRVVRKVEVLNAD